MTRVLSGLDSPSPTLPEPTPDDDSVYFNSEFILFIGLFVIFCFLICLILLNACACWLRPRSTSSNPSSTEEDHFSQPLPLPLPLPLPAAKLLRTIPKLTYSGADNFTDCAICLTEFVPGDEIRVLPRCGHCFHVVCVDRWIIGSHFTCPSCRQMLLKTTEI